MVPYSNSTVLPSGRKVTRTMLDAGGWLRSISCVLCSFILFSLQSAQLLLLNFGGSERMRRGRSVTELFARGFHGLSADGSGDGCVHHQLGHAARGFVEGVGSGAQGCEIIALLEDCELIRKQRDVRSLLIGELL